MIKFSKLWILDRGLFHVYENIVQLLGIHLIVYIVIYVCKHIQNMY